MHLATLALQLRVTGVAFIYTWIVNAVKNIYKRVAL